jgi:hypothetical protein
MQDFKAAFVGATRALSGHIDNLELSLSSQLASFLAREPGIQRSELKRPQTIIPEII